MAGPKIYDKLVKCAEHFAGQEVTNGDIKNWIAQEFPGTNRSSVIPADYCYNIINCGAEFKGHLFEYIENGRRGNYKCLGKNFPYTGRIGWKESKSDRPERKVVGEWNNGKFIIFDEFRDRFIL